MGGYYNQQLHRIGSFHLKLNLIFRCYPFRLLIPRSSYLCLQNVFFLYITEFTVSTICIVFDNLQLLRPKAVASDDLHLSQLTMQSNTTKFRIKLRRENCIIPLDSLRDNRKRNDCKQNLTEPRNKEKKH